MVVVGPDLIKEFFTNPLVEKAYEILEGDEEVQTLLRMSNVMAVKRLNYNDHGPVHSRIVAGSALEVFRLVRGKAGSSMVKNGTGTLQDAELVVMMGAYLHDIGNSIHRTLHPLHGVCIAKPILDRLLPQIYAGTGKSRRELYMIRQEILHAIYAHDDDVQALTVEAGTVKVGDGTDMAGGRARVPYRFGRGSIHAFSALAIKRVRIEGGKRRPVRIIVEAKNPAGIFQIEYVMHKKIQTSGLKRFISVIFRYGGKSRRVSL